MKNKKGVAEFTVILWAVGVILASIGVEISVTKQVNWPDFKAKPRTVDTAVNPAPSNFGNF